MIKRTNVKALLCLMLSLYAYGLMHADHLTPEQALQRMEQPNSMKKISGIKPSLCHSEKIDGEDCLYVFNKGNQGFVIAPAEDSMPPILGYSENGRFDYDKIPPALKWMLEQYALSAKLSKQKGRVISNSPSTRSSRAPIEPLIQTQWGQGNPYNYFCPEIDGEKCEPGTAATAMAQIINYHRYPEVASGFHEYEWNEEGISCDFGSTHLDYEMMEQYVGEMPWLVYACGVSVETNFDRPFRLGGKVDETKIPIALTSFFNYDSGISLIYREMISSEDEWEDIIYSELEVGRPVLYVGRYNIHHPGGGFFICDGYHEDSGSESWMAGMFHINWGYDGEWDGYFNLEEMDMRAYDFLAPGDLANEFNYNHSIICGIQPPSDEGQEQHINSIYAIGGIQEVTEEYWDSSLRVTFDGGVFSYQPTNYWPEWDRPQEVMFYIKTVSEDGEEFISEQGTPVMFYPKDKETLMRGYNEIGPLYPPYIPSTGEYKSYLIYETEDGEMHDLKFRSNESQYFISRVSDWGGLLHTEYQPDYEHRSKWLYYSNPDFGIFPENKIISGIPSPFHYHFYNEYGYEGLVYVRLFKHDEQINPYNGYVDLSYNLKKEHVFKIDGYNEIDGLIDLTFDLAPGEYELICYDQNGDRMIEPLTLIIEAEEGSYQLDYTVTLENPDLWNHIGEPIIFNFQSIYSHPIGLEGRIEYSVDNREWEPLNYDMLYEGAQFQSSIYAQFNPALDVHSINLRIVDVEGNITMVEPMKFPDINFIEFDPIMDEEYNGEAHYPNVTSPEIDSDGFIVTEYYDNVNAGTASIVLEGVYPKSIGSRWCDFQILPLHLQGTITLAQTEFDFTGKDIRPEYQLEGSITELQSNGNKDYEIRYENNRYAGTAYVRAHGNGNYTGFISASFNINRIDCPEDWISYKLPNADITFDGEQHKATANAKDGMGKAILTYECSGESSTEAPVSPGDYDVYLQYNEGRGVNAVPNRKIGQFSIYELNDRDWQTLLALNDELSEANEMDSIWYAPKTDSKAWPGKLNNHGLKIEQGAIRSLNLSKKGLKGELPVSAFRFKNIEELSLEENQLTGRIDRLSAIMDADSSAMAGLRKLALNNNMIEGNAGVLARLPNLERIAINDNCISDIIPMIAKDKTLIYKNQTLKERVTFDFSNLDFESLDSGLPSIALYDHSAQRYSFEGTSIDLSDDNGWDIQMRFNEGRMSKTSSTEDVFTGSRHDMLDAQISPINCKARMALKFQPGDVDFNSFVNVLDIQAMINHIFDRRWHVGYSGNSWYDPFNHTAANLYEDEVINVQDAVRLIDVIMESDPTDKKNMRKAPKASENAEAESYAFIDNGSIVLSSEEGIAAFDIIIEDPEISLISLPGFTLTKRVYDGKTRIIGYSLSGQTLPEGCVRIGYSDASEIKYAMLSDINAQEIRVALNDHTTGVSTIEAANLMDIHDEYIHLSIPAGSSASWQIATVNGVILVNGAAVANQEGILIPFKGEAGSVYVISVNHEGKQMHKKIIKN